ncbi:MAG: cation:proton antiporter [Theionarchaea archaeon]|nr:cation:proton antiporter [Theionarchaea archaeon]
MKFDQANQYRNLAALAFFLIFAGTVLVTFYNLEVIPGISYIYSLISPNIAPNAVGTIVFDFRGYDTLGETLILITSVITVGVVFGRGAFIEEEKAALKHVVPTSIQSVFGAPTVLILMCFGLLLIFGGHITPGGGFQGGSVLATAFFISIVIYGIKTNPFHYGHDFLIGMETLGALMFLLIGVIGVATSGYYLYNVGSNIWGHGLLEALKYVDPTNAGILPYLNVAVGLEVFGSLSIAAVFLAEARKHD